MTDNEKTQDIAEAKQNENRLETEETNSGNKLKDALIRQQGAFKGPMSFDEFATLLDKLDEDITKK